MIVALSPINPLFRDQILLHKAKLKEYKRLPQQSLAPWSFYTPAIFERLDAYLVRLTEIKEMLQTASDFFKLEKIEIGGIKGRSLMQKLSEVLNEFQTLFNTCIGINSNPLEPENEHFACLRENYNMETVLLERKLAQMLYEAFGSCPSIISAIKLVEMIGSLAGRPAIRDQISTHFNQIIDQFQDDMDTVEQFISGAQSYEQSVSNAI